MAISVVQLGSARKEKGLRIGTVRRPPRGISKENYSKLNYFDAWLPMLSPSVALLKLGQKAVTDDRQWEQFKKKFKVEMREAEAARLLILLAALSHQTDLSIGCHCRDESRCHRSVLKELLIGYGAELA